MNMFCNVECEPIEADHLVAAAQPADFTITPKGTYSFSQNDNETIGLEFI